MEPIEILLDNLRKSIQLTEREETLIANNFHTVVLHKKEFLLSPGQVSQHMRFIAKGCLRAFYMDESAKEHVVQFGVEGWWVNDLYSYLTQTPAKQFVQALEPSTVLQIHRDALNRLYEEVPAMERFYREKFERAYVSLQDRTLNAMSKTAEERYIEFRSRYRGIEQRVPQYMVASYLGITPEFLSSLRKNLK